MIDPIKKSLVVPLDKHSAFDLFTDGIDRWWPTESHSLAAYQGDKPLSVHVEPHVGGHVIETMKDGKQAPWATVLAFEPGDKLVLSWYVGRDESEATQITVVFSQIEAGTRVDLTHEGFDALGSDATAMLENYTTGWDSVLGVCYAGACAPVTA